MKRIVLFLATFLVLSFISINSNAQSTADFFVGRWNLLVAGTPEGDIKMIMSLERKEG